MLPSTARQLHQHGYFRSRRPQRHRGAVQPNILAIRFTVPVRLLWSSPYELRAVMFPSEASMTS